MERRMAYAEYKKEWARCKTVPGSYDKSTKMVAVIIPDALWEMAQIVPAAEVEAYRQELVAVGRSEFNNLHNIMQQYAREFAGCTLADFDGLDEQTAAWIAKAIEAANKY